MVGFDISALTSFFRNPRATAAEILRRKPADQDRKRKREKSVDATQEQPDQQPEPPAKRAATAMQMRSQQPQQKQPQDPQQKTPMSLLTAAHGPDAYTHQSAFAFGLPAAEPIARQRPSLFTPGFQSTVRQFQSRRTLAGSQTSAVRQSAPLISGAGFAASQLVTPVLSPAGHGTPSGNGPLPPETAASYRHSTRTRGSTPGRVRGPGQANAARLQPRPSRLGGTAGQHWQPSPPFAQVASARLRPERGAEPMSAQRPLQQRLFHGGHDNSSATARHIAAQSSARHAAKPPVSTAGGSGRAAHQPAAAGGGGGNRGGFLAQLDGFYTAYSHSYLPALVAREALQRDKHEAEKSNKGEALQATLKKLAALMDRNAPGYGGLMRRADAAVAPRTPLVTPEKPNDDARAAEAAPAADQQQLHPQQHQRKQMQPQQQKPAPPSRASEPPADADVVDLLDSSDDEEGAEAAAVPEDGSEFRSSAAAYSAASEEEGISSALQEAGLSDEEEDEEEEEEDDDDAAESDAWVKPLTAAQRRRWREALAAGSPKEVLVGHDRAGIDIRRVDIACMAGSAWLNDEVINIYMALLQDRDTERRKRGLGPKCHFFNSFFVNKLIRDKGEYNYSEVRRWTLEKRLKRTGQASASVLDCDRVVIPVHLGAHWTCAVVDFAEECLWYFDSLLGKERSVVEALARWAGDEYHNKRQQVVDTTGWPRRYERAIPRQLNGSDCGVFAIQFADAAGRGVPLTPPPFSQHDMPNLRIKVTADIMAQHVDG